MATQVAHRRWTKHHGLTRRRRRDGVAIGQRSGVTPDYLAAIGIALVAGRDFTIATTATSERVVIISESVAQRAFPGRSPIGATLRIRGDSVHTARVVGVARDTKMFGLRGERRPGRLHAGDADGEVAIPRARRPHARWIESH